MKKIVSNIISSLLAGFFIGLGGIGFILAKNINNQFLGAAIFPIGLFMICVLGLNLYTGKIGFIFNDYKERGLLFYIVMIISNFIGVGLVGLFYRLSNVNNESILNTINAISSSKINNGYVLFFIKSILCGMMVYLAVYLYKQTDNGFLKALYVFLPIFMFVLFGFDHCIADFFYFVCNFDFSLSMWLHLLVCIVGNSVGSIILNFAIKVVNNK